MKAEQREYLSYVSLMILGVDLDPIAVSLALGMRPSQCWNRGDPKLPSDSASLYEWGGWKRSLPPKLMNQPLEVQIRYWATRLRAHVPTFQDMAAHSYYCALNVYIGTYDTASIILPAKLQQELAGLGLEIRLSVWVHGPAAT